MKIEQVIKGMRKRKIKSAQYQSRHTTGLHIDLNETFPSIRKSFDGSYVEFTLTHEDLQADWQVTFKEIGIVYDFVTLHGVKENGVSKPFIFEYVHLEDVVREEKLEGWNIVGGTLYKGPHIQHFDRKVFETAVKVADEQWRENL